MSVVVLNWNSGSMLLECLESIWRQQGLASRHALEVILVDNASCDDSVDRALERWPSLPVIRLAHNTGFGAGVNAGIRAARGEHVALINPDAIAEPGWLREMLAAMEKEKRVGSVASKVLLEPGSDADGAQRIDSCGHLIGRDGQNFCRGRGEEDRGQFDQDDEVFSFSGAACLLRRRMLDEVGLFDEDYFLYGEDAELGLRSRIAGWRCICAPAAVVRHRLSSGLGLFSLRKGFYIERNRLWLLWTHYPLSMILSSPLLRLRQISRYGAFLRRRGGDFPWWMAMLAPPVLLSAKLAAVVGLPNCLRKRSRFRASRDVGRPSAFGEMIRRFEITPRAAADRY